MVTTYLVIVRRIVLYTKWTKTVTHGPSFTKNSHIVCCYGRVLGCLLCEEFEEDGVLCTMYPFIVWRKCRIMQCALAWWHNKCLIFIIDGSSSVMYYYIPENPVIYVYILITHFVSIVIKPIVCCLHNDRGQATRFLACTYTYGNIQGGFKCSIIVLLQFKKYVPV